MVIFAIPLRAKCMTKNWHKCCKRTKRTVDSIYQNTNRNFIGIELDKNYFDIANRRINGEN